MNNPIEEKRRFVQAQIQKSFDSGINIADEIELEKAHKDGDHHPTKPWVWVSSANGGKGDWRVEGGRAHKKAGASTAPQTFEAFYNQFKRDYKWNHPTATDMQVYDEAMKAYKKSKTTDAAVGDKVDISKIPDAEFKRITQMLEKKNPDHTDAPRHLEEEEMSDKELKNFYAVAEHFKNSSKINKLTQEHCRKWGELARQEMQYRKKASTADTVSQKDYVTSKEFSKNKAIVGEMLKDCDSKIDSNGVKKYHCKFYALGKDRSSSWLKQSDIEAYLRNYNDAKVTAIKSEQSSTTPAPRKPGSTNEIERMTPTAVHNAIIGLNNTGTNVKDKGDHFLIEFDHNDFTTHGQRSPQIDRIAKFLESMGASCVIGKNEIKAYKKVEAKKNTTNKTQSPQDKVKNIMQQFDDTTMDEDEFDEYVDSVLGNDMGQKLRKEILNGNKSFSDKKQAYKDAVERHLGLKPQKYSNMDIKDAKKALVGKVVTLKDYWPDGRGGSQDAVGEIKNVRLYGKNKLPIAEISYPNGDEQMIRLDEIDDGKMKDSYKTPIAVGDDKTHLNAVKKKIANNSDPRDKIAQDAGFKDYEEMKGYQDYVTQKNLLKKRSTSAGMRLLYEREVAKYEKDHSDLIKKMQNK